MKATQNYHNGHTKFKFSMTIVVILYDSHTLEFAVYSDQISIDIDTDIDTDID